MPSERIRMPTARSRPRRAVAAALTAALTSAALLTACTGGDGSSDDRPRAKLRAGAGQSTGKSAEPYAGLKPREILELVEENLDKARSAQVQVSFDAGDGPEEYTLRATRKGRGRGRMTDPAGGLIKIMVIAGTGYMLPSSSLLDDLAEGDAEVRRELRGRWLEAPLGYAPDWAGTFDLLDLEFLLDDLVGVSSRQRNLVQVKGRTFGGRETIGLRRKNLHATLYVAADGSGELVASVDADGRAVFSRWNEKIRIKAPTRTYPLGETGATGPVGVSTAVT